MIGAIIGDVVGSTYEFNNTKNYNFELLTPRSAFTDDTVMTMAVAQWLMDDPGHHHRTLVDLMQRFGHDYPGRGYGGRFAQWLHYRKTEPYNSLGNGSGMRVSPVGYYAKTLEQALELARVSAEVTHNHPEGVKGAQAIAACIFMARAGYDKSDIRAFVKARFGYDLDRRIADVRQTYHFDETCPGSVPEAIICFLEGNTFEEVLRLAVWLGGDTDTVACMACSIAAAVYPVPNELACKVFGLLDDRMRDIVKEFTLQCFKRNGEHADQWIANNVITFDNLRLTLNHAAKGYRQLITPHTISTLHPGEIFVFGSNLAGAHGGGAAAVAMSKFGAKWGVGVGMQGQSYAIPTMQGGVETIRPYVDQFIEFARLHPELTFYVTRIGCGIAGFTPREIAPLFSAALGMTNVALPMDFIEVLNNNE